jgi:hypothetical protein
VAVPVLPRVTVTGRPDSTFYVTVTDVVVVPPLSIIVVLPTVNDTVGCASSSVMVTVCSDELPIMQLLLTSQLAVIITVSFVSFSKSPTAESKTEA